MPVCSGNALRRDSQIVRGLSGICYEGGWFLWHEEARSGMRRFDQLPVAVLVIGVFVIIVVAVVILHYWSGVGVTE